MFALFLEISQGDGMLHPLQQSKTPPLPEATWGKRILVVWNKAAREQLNTKNPWLGKLKKPIASGNLELLTVCLQRRVNG